MTTPTHSTSPIAQPVTVWCGGCSLVPDDRYVATCPRCGSPLTGIVADRLRSLTVDHDAAVREGRRDDAYELALEHTGLKARSAAPVVPVRTREPVAAAKVVSWLGAGLVVAGGIAFTAVVWNVAGGTGRLAILAAITLLAFLGAWRLRRRTPVTAEALTLVAAGMVVVDAIVPVAAGYVVDDAATPWFAATSTAAAALFVLLGRAWDSTTARLASVALAAVAGAALIVAVLDVVDVTTDAGMLGVTVIGGLLVAGVVVAADLLSRWPRAAVLTGAWTAWLGLFLFGCVWQLLASLGGTGDDRSASALLNSAAMLVLVLAPLVARPRTGATGVLLALSASGAAGWAVVLAETSRLYVGPTAAVLGVALGTVITAVVALGALALGRDPGSGSVDASADARRTRGVVVGVVLPVGWLALTMGMLVEVVSVHGQEMAGYALISVATIAAAVRVLGRSLVPPTALAVVESLAATTGLTGAVLVVASMTGWSGGAVAAAASVLAALASLLLPESRRVPLWCAALVTLVLAPVLGTSSVEQLSVPAAAVALVLGVELGRRTEASSWFTEAPAALLLLVPTLWIGIADDDVQRMAVVAVAATGVLVVSGWHHRQGPAAVAAVALAIVAVWALAPRASEIPLWAVLSGCGALLLWVGFTWEARRTTAKHLVQQWREWS